MHKVEEETGELQSRWNGFKLMSPQVAAAIRYCDQAFPPNIHGIRRGNPKEQGVVIHEHPQTGRMAPGRMMFGTQNSLDASPELAAPSARVDVHNHPYTGEQFSEAASMRDQLYARENRHVEHIVQTPAPNPGAANPYITYSGAFPPRYYTLVPNPRNLPIPPPSPDGDQMPPFHSPPRGP